ncbi:RIP metalloprotease RseP [Janthinobacterium sp. 17J80-10]|uniref:RIP metalloprotease RseP n=1 Tax=Janthinobacterium sp. 17J80-10 TaxID=2497863 RepID=UPI00100594B7|nr:RIP metalloprotease RseP [Janthinobacterium sp. 17J80-10]QAU34622.1 RIP metalloprotease RseP [Janthinobacterium sp. 17J80-10]
MNLLQTLLAFIFVLGTLIVVHELGHYWIARWCGVKVLRFSVGMGKVLWSRRIGPDRTEWALSALPFGGYVKMLDAREEDVSGLPPEDLAREFTRQSVWKRIAIVAAGPLANFLLAIVIFTGLYINGIPEPAPLLRTVPASTAAHEAGLRGGELVTAINGEPVQIWSDMRWQLIQLAVAKQAAVLEVRRTRTDTASYTVTLPLDSIGAQDLEGDFLGKLGLDLARPRAIFGKLAENGPAMMAGFRQGDVILAVDGVAIKDGVALIELVRASPGKSLRMRVLRDGRELDLAVTPLAREQGGKTIGQIQVEIPVAPEMVTASSPPFAAVTKAVQRTWDSSVLTLKMLGKMLVGELSWKNISGPITIADYAGQTARIGIISYLSFIALISISLGVMNLLPIPVLDGGHLLYYSLEVLTGRPLSERVGEIAQRAGVGILMALMAVAVFNDIVRLMS